jgi:NADH-quinone oxidoreductase subunit J
MLQGIAFYLLSAVAVVSGLLVVTARNPVHSVLWLILAFFSSAGLFVLLGAEFLAMLLVVVYVGAVAVLFLFVVMMLDVDFVRLREGYATYLPLAAIVAGILLAEMVMISIVVVQGGAASDAVAPRILTSRTMPCEPPYRRHRHSSAFVRSDAGSVPLPVATP